ncbi:LLM class flavin-dependent oxidoreductase [Rugosimonospora africana]|uniref:N5,N10-methylene tetrahydromethanopterin reductase n=1 Tax=Rugosimonospora africana TaxID=556532 RepID=A0A8J3QYA0_9ACTN|nr:LLM class flavin-dependent oxidoreductase [Rugosimonospora africana]GIH18317.1 N5,N10-methylene tetrahydromethanopterin reductase [Rugosimonospora africana]
MADLVFGLDLPAAVSPGYDPVASARQAEDLGFDFMSTSDHPCGTAPSYETWTMLSWVAAQTSRIRVATRVLGVPYRAPAMVAKMAETLDRFSGGRLILGLGGGYSDDEFRAFGLGVPTPGEKVDGLSEAIQIARGLWSQPRFSFAGRRYGVREADVEPKPEHRIPIWVGTYGNRALALTGALADGWIPSYGFAPPERIPAMRERILAAAAEAGRPADAITGIYNVGIRVDDRAEPEPSTVVGGPEEVAERLAGLVGLGFAGFNFQPIGADRDLQAQRLAQEVIPLVRAAVA